MQRVRRRAPVVLGGLVLATALTIGIAATRTAGPPEPPPLPPGAVTIDAWAPYWTLGVTLPEVESRFAELREISPFWFAATGAASIEIDANSPFDASSDFIDAIRDAGRAFVPSIVDHMDAGGMAAVLANPRSRKIHIDTIMAFAERIDADGIDLDYEQFAFADGSDTWLTTRPNWVAFIKELSARLHAEGRTLTVSVPPIQGDPANLSGYWVYDHGTIAPMVDAIRIMAYDFSVAESGPIAPLDWVQDSVDTISAVVAPEFHDRLVLGIPSYGSNWVTATEGVCPSTAEGRTNVTTRTVDELATRRGGVPRFDEVNAEWWFVYDLVVDDGVTSCVQSREVRWVDAEGVRARIEIARRAGWGGVALWALGYEDAEVWDTLVAASHDPLTP